MKKSNVFSNVTELKNHILKMTDIPESDIKIDGDFIIISASSDGMIPECKVGLHKDKIGFEIDDGEIKRTCNNDKESFDEEWGDLTEIFCQSKLESNQNPELY